MIKKIIYGLLALVVLLIAGFTIYVQTGWDHVYEIDYPDLQISTDSAVIAHGEYLVKGPAHCTGCHVKSFEDMVRLDKGEDLPLQGGVEFALGPLGYMYPKNLTPDKETGLGQYEPKEIFRVMRHGVLPSGLGMLTPMMPFYNMADEDMVAIVSYLMSREPVHNPIPANDWTFMGKAVRTLSPTFKPIIDPTPPDQAPAMEATVERGEYLARYVANCVGCHTPRDMMTFEATGPEFSGGMEFEPFPELHRQLGVDEDLWARSVNITPHEKGALYRFPTVESWIQRFRAGRVIKQSPMDWGAFSKMTDEDLEALYLFLNSLDPVENNITEVVFKKE